ncbi:MAG: hypothetical protein SH847_14535 [Roseiflexaceae bacterium]|nr:hypothetical protein [Roseiflexaceae bacterium]
MKDYTFIELAKMYANANLEAGGVIQQLATLVQQLAAELASLKLELAELKAAK